MCLSSLDSYTNSSSRQISFLNADLSNEEEGLKELARKFTQEEIIPVAAHHDKTGEVGLDITYDF